MRSFLAGLFFLIIPTAAFAQVTGLVESIGFGNSYRPDCWTPMVVQLKSDIAEPANYQLRVYQDDLDKDHPVYVKDIALGGKQTERYWTYFLPQPSGLPDSMGGASQAAKELEKALKVKLFTPGGKQVGQQLSISFAITNLDPKRAYGTRTRGTKLILYVKNSEDLAWRDYEVAKGLSEDVLMVSAFPKDLPEDVRGYEAVDGIVWLDANADELSAGGARILPALQDYVRQGGRMVICQPNEKFKIEALSDLCPIFLKDAGDNWTLDIRDRQDLTALLEMAQPPVSIYVDNPSREKMAEGWKRIEQRGAPFKIAYAKPKPGAVVERWIDWSTDSKQSVVTPYVARIAYGLGTVTWIAQDLGNRGLMGPDASGWPYIWDRVFGWKQLTLVLREGQDPEKRIDEAFQVDSTVDLGHSLVSGMEHTSRAGYYIFLAVIFFIAYWVLAGPGSYFFLASKQRKQLSWMVYAVCAIAATALTILVVRLVLRGAPEAHHITIVRAVQGSGGSNGEAKWSAVAHSRIGLYIPSDGMQQVALKDNQAGAVSYVSPFAVPPHYHNPEQGWNDGQPYDVPIRDATATDPVSIEVPYRSTLKKLQARWVGSIGGGIGGSAKLISRDKPLAQKNGKPLEFSPIDGHLMNQTGRDLRNIYFAFYSPPEGGAIGVDWVLYVPRWMDQKPLELADEFRAARQLNAITGANLPGHDYNVRGWIERQWDEYWYSGLGTSNMNELFDDSDQSVRKSFPMMALFDRLKPQAARGRDINGTHRVELVRRSGRELDVSSLMGAGQLIVLAQSDVPGPLPFPLEVRGNRTEGVGTTLYEFAMPLDRSEIPATQPAAET